MIYAAVGASGMFFILVAGLLFLMYWPPTREFMTLLLAWGIGLGITVGLKMILTMIFGKNYWKGMYRNRPAASNISSLAYECWHLGLGGGVMVSRLCQFLLAAAFWIGRIDSQFLGDDVEVFGYHFDTVPSKYFAEILEHEAHRHPYIERLAGMYLMRLKHGEYFSGDAGAQWRVVFTLTLMPWLVKFSQARGNDDDNDDEDSDENADEADDDWATQDSGAFAADENGYVEWSGNGPRIPSDGWHSPVPSEDADDMKRSGRNVSWNQFWSTKSFGSSDEDVGQRGEMVH